MREYLENLSQWISEKKKISIIRVVETWGSSPRPVGSVMLVNEDGKILGSVSGGCVEGDVVKNVLNFRDQEGIRILQYGITSQEAWSVGLSCGGKLKVLMEKLDYEKSLVWKELIEAIQNDESAVLVTSLNEEKNKIVLYKRDQFFGDEIDDSLKSEIKKAFRENASVKIETEGEEFFIQTFPKKPKLLIIGAVHIATELVRLGKMNDFETVVIDPRGFFSDNIIFSESPDRMINDYPSEAFKEFTLDRNVFVAILSHDPKIDDDALEILLKNDVAYIGALGGRKTQMSRRERLSKKGFEDSEIDRIHGPIGIDINALGSREIALSTMAEIIKVKNIYLKK